MSRKGDMDWVVYGGQTEPGPYAASWGQFVDADPTGTGNSSNIAPLVVLSAQQFAEPWTTIGGVNQEEDELFVERVVGQTFCYPVLVTGDPADVILTVDERIHLMLVNMQTGILQPAVDSLSTAFDAEEKFLWHRTYVVHTTTNLNDSVAFMPWNMSIGYSTVDVRAGRKLTTGFAIAHTFDCTIVSNPDDAIINWVFLRRLRSLVKWM